MKNVKAEVVEKPSSFEEAVAVFAFFTMAFIVIAALLSFTAMCIAYIPMQIEQSLTDLGLHSLLVGFAVGASPLVSIPVVGYIHYKAVAIVCKPISKLLD